MRTEFILSAAPALLWSLMEDQAAFSPDGRFICFVSTYSGNANVYRLPFRPDKTISMKGAKNLTHKPAAD